ncbi:hypothetical protein [Plantactinospora sonchi]|uniref:VWA containing CoxE family protein n=1 Tax=Plantactinospora sonchi TaxID=1544735 RepID=A0ABU7S400_9ACTN
MADRPVTGPDGPVTGPAGSVPDAEPGPAMPPFVHELVVQLRRRGIPLGIDDCVALRQALAAGFGWSSSSALLRLCVSLWAKSATEETLIRAAFSRVELPEWTVDTVPSDPPVPVQEDVGTVLPAPTDQPGAAPTPESPTPAPRLTPQQVRHALPPLGTGRSDRSLVLSAHYPVTERQVAQIWRGLRRPTRHGPAVELDVPATLDRFARTGLPTPPVLVPPRRNSTRLLLLVDRQGSMTPFHDYVDHVRRSIASAGRLDSLLVGYFHNTAGRSPDQHLLAELPDPFAPAIDPVVRLVAPLAEGRVYDDPELTRPRRLTELLATATRDADAVVIGDAGAARGGFSSSRLLDTVAFARTLSLSVRTVAWLNPVPPARWQRTTAEQVARHLPMFPLTREGMYRAVDVLRGRPAKLERAL